ncbi:MAG TPA: MBG domain-containing protein [Bryobacteraceae bacterium]|nr:MBG domain-containing protein [Bryobacteraceae bacterium]
MLRTRLNKFLPLGILILLPQFTWAADSLTFFNNWFVTGDYAVAGVGLRGGGAGKNGGWATGKINMSGVPSNAQPIAAFLYWSTVESSQTPKGMAGYFNGSPITGQVLGTPNSPCGNGAAAAFVYRADVLRFLPINSSNVFQANGNQTVKLPDSTASVLYTNGASLVVIYRIFVPGNPHIAPLRAVAIYDGAYTLTKSTPAFSLNFGSLYQVTSNAQARVTGVAANGQNGFSAPWSVNGHTVGSNPFDGDQGSRWDNQSYNISLPANASSFLNMETASGNTCVTWAAMIASANVQDSDNDGLLDIWETAGLYRDTTASPAAFGTCADAAKAGKSCVNLPAMGANPRKQDIFIQADWMYSDGININGMNNPRHSHMPALHSLNLVASTFALHGINVHFDVGNNYQGAQLECGNGTTTSAVCNFIIPTAYAAVRPLPDTSSGINEQTLLCQGSCAYGNLPYPVTSFEFGFDSIRDGNQSIGVSAHLSEDRFWAFRYALFAHALGGPYDASGNPIITPPQTAPTPLSYSGIAQLPGGGFMVTFGLWTSDNQYNLVGTPFEVASTTAHELGHTLGLGHAGLNSTPNCMPNYPSVMNYMYQIRGLTDASGNEQVDYSYGLLLPLSEKLLSTSIPIALPGIQHYKVRFYGPGAGPLAPPGAPSQKSQAASVHCDGSLSNEGLFKLEGAAVSTPDWSDGNVALGKLIQPIDLNNGGTLDLIFLDQPDWFVLNLQQIGSSPDFGGLSVGAKTSDSGAKASDAGAKASDAGAKASDMGAFPNTGVSYSNAGAVATDSGAKASDAGELDEETVVSSGGLPAPTNLMQSNTANSIVLTWTPSDAGGGLTYNVYRCAGVGCDPTTGSPFKMNISGGTTPSFTDTVDNNNHGGTACPSADTCPNTTYIYSVTAVGTATVNGQTTHPESGFSNTAASEVTELFVVVDNNADYGNDNTYTYDGNNHTAAYHVFGDVAASLNAASVTCTTARNWSASNYPAPCSGPPTTSPTNSVTYVANGATYIDSAGIHTGGTLIINQRPITVTAATSSKTYDATTSSPAMPTITTGSLGTGDSVTWTETYDTPTVGTTHTMTPAGTVSDTNSGNNYAVTFVNATNGVILTRNVTATLTAQNKVYDGTNTEPNPSMSCILNNAVGGDSVSCTASNGTFNSSQVASATTVSATATLGGSAAINYTFGAVGTAVNSVTPVTAPAIITPAPVTATAGGYNSNYDGATHSPTPVCAVTPIAPNTFTGTLACTNNPASVGPNVGSGSVTPVPAVGGGDNLSNYAITSVNGAWRINPAPVTATAGSYSGTYDGTTHSPTPACAVTGPYTGTLTCANNPASVGPNVGSGSVVPAPAVGGTDSLTNYAITPVNGSWTITAAPVTATAGNYSGTYDGSSHATSAACAVTGPYTGTLTCANNPVSVTNAGSGSVTPVPAVGGTDSLSNYAITPANGAWSIAKASSTTAVTCPAGPYYYTGLAQTPCAVSVTGAGSLSQMPTPTYSNNINAGLATASYTFAGDANHNGSNGSANFTIMQAPLTIIASGASVMYGSPVPAIGAGYSGFVNNENASVLSSQPSCATSYTPMSPSSPPPYPSYQTSCAGAAAANYAISYMPGSINVSQAPLQITASSTTITQGAPVPSITPGYSGFVNSENYTNLTTQPACSTTYTVGSPASPPTYPTTCSGAVDNNYNISYVAGTVTVNAAAAPLAITAGPVAGFQNYTYPATLLAATGGTPPYTWSGASIAGMNLTAGGVLTGYPTAAGTANVTVTDANNNSVSAQLTINSSTVVLGDSGDVTTISNVTLNGGPVQLTATPGTSITVNLTYNLTQTGYCPGCIDQLVVGFVNTTPTTCVYDGGPGAGTGDQPGVVNLTAPNTPGRYYIVFNKTYNYTCQPSPPGPDGSAYTLVSTDPAIAVVDVIPTSSVTVGDVTATNISITPQVFTGGQVTATFSWSNAPTYVGTIGLGFNTDPTIDECGGQVTSPLTAPSLPGRYYLSLANPNTCSSPPVPWPSGIPGANFTTFMGAVDVLPQPHP